MSFTVGNGAVGTASVQSERNLLAFALNEEHVVAAQYFIENDIASALQTRSCEHNLFDHGFNRKVKRVLNGRDEDDETEDKEDNGQIAEKDQGQGDEKDSKKAKKSLKKEAKKSGKKDDEESESDESDGDASSSSSS